MLSVKADIRKINTRLSGKHGLRNQGSQGIGWWIGQANTDGAHPCPGRDASRWGWDVPPHPSGNA